MPVVDVVDQRADVDPLAGGGNRRQRGHRLPLRPEVIGEEDGRVAPPLDPADHVLPALRGKLVELNTEAERARHVFSSWAPSAVSASWSSGWSSRIRSSYQALRSSSTGRSSRSRISLR